jgi:hypothetical protein
MEQAAAKDQAQPKEQAAPKAQSPPKEETKSKIEAKAAAPAKDEKSSETTSEAPASLGTPAMPTIINKPQGSSAAPASVPQPEEKPAAPEDAPTAKTTAGAGTSAKPDAEAKQPEPSPSAPVANEIATGSLSDEAAKSEPLALLTNPMAATALALLGVLVASSFVVWSRRQERRQIGARVRRDIASVSLGGAEAQAHPQVAFKTQAPDATATATAQAPAPVPGDGAELPMPTTPGEALQLLGASPDAAIEVIKKIVDGLRQSWHPDLARSEDDRRLREQRMRQINVAWDIISGQRSAA